MTSNLHLFLRQCKRTFHATVPEAHIVKNMYLLYTYSITHNSMQHFALQNYHLPFLPHIYSLLHHYNYIKKL